MEIIQLRYFMAVPQQKLREISFQLLYSKDIGKSDEKEMVPLLMKELAVTRKAVESAQEKVHLIEAVLEELDTMIAEASFSYAFERIQTVERNILRLGVFELFFDDKIPAKVAISEAIRLTRKFGTPESAGFVNAILDTLYKASRGEEVDVQQIVESAEKMTQSESTAENAAKTNTKKVKKASANKD